MMKVQGGYKGYIVEAVWNGGLFRIMDDGNEVATVKTIEDAERWIDAKTKKKYRRVKCFILQKKGWGGPSEWVPAEVTSVASDREAWTVTCDDNRSRRLLPMNAIIPETNETLVAIKKINAMYKKVVEINAEIDVLIKAAGHIKADMVEEK